MIVMMSFAAAIVAHNHRRTPAPRVAVAAGAFALAAGRASRAWPPRTVRRSVNVTTAPAQITRAVSHPSHARPYVLEETCVTAQAAVPLTPRMPWAKHRPTDGLHFLYLTTSGGSSLYLCPAPLTCRSCA